jgi:hypothetical protein
VNSKAYKYDVAISFLSRDEQAAQALYDSLSPNFEVFFYPRNQEELAGTDGIDSLRQAFRNESRVVTVLYRDGWGQTPWTRVEEDGIKDRFLGEGWHWLLFIMLDNASTAPKWLPERKIRLSFQDYGHEQAVGAIKARIQEVGGIVRRDDAIQRARRVEKILAARSQRESMLMRDGLPAARAEARIVFDEMARLVEQIARDSPALGLKFGQEAIRFVITTGRASANILLPFAATPNSARLILRTWRGRLQLPGEGRLARLREPEEQDVHSFLIDFKPQCGWCWRSTIDPSPYFTSTELADFCVSTFLDFAVQGSTVEDEPYDE